MVMKKYIIILLVFLMCISCVPLDEPEVIQEKKQPEEIQIKEPEIEIPKEPLAISLSIPIIQAELSLSTTATCSASGGTQPYHYTWKSNDPALSVQHCDLLSCPISINKIGSYQLSCTVIDTDKSTRKSSVSLSVIKKQEQIDTVIFFGDSLTEGYGLEQPETTNWAYLYKTSLSKADIYNYAVSGATTFSIKDYQLSQYDTDYTDNHLNNKNKIIFLWIGANDIVSLINTDIFKQNYESIIQSIINKPNTKLILLTIPDASKLSIATAIEQDVNTLLQSFGVQGSLEVKAITKDIITLYNDIIYELAITYNLPVIDMFTFLETIDQKYITDDFFHPNEAGHQEIKKKVQEDITIIYPDTEFE